MAFNGNTFRVIKNGTNIKPEVKYSTEADKFRAVFSGSTIDLASRAISTFRGTGPTRKVFKFTPNTPFGDGEEKNIVNRDMVDILNNTGILGLHKNTPKSHTAIKGFTFQYQQQQNIRTSTVDAAVQAWGNLNRLKTNNTGALYVFDLETYGGTTTDRRWAPAGITEFAMQKYDFATKKQTSTSILMTNDQTIAGLEKMYKRYETLMQKGIDHVKAENDVYVFAMRMSLHARSKGADFELDEGTGLWKVTQFVDSSKAAAGDVAAVKEGYEEFVKMNKELKSKNLHMEESTGLSYDQLAFIDATGEMSRAVAAGQGIIGGHNILHFDRPVLDQGIMNIYNAQLDIINSISSTTEQKDRARNAVNYINSVFGGSVGTNFSKGFVLDTLPLMRAAHDDSGFINTPNLQLETLYKAFYNEMQGTAHLGEYDTRMNMSMILDPSSQLGGKSLVAHIMDNNILQSNSSNRAVDFNSNQVFKAVGNISGAGSSGRGFANHRVYSNGEIFTSGGYRIQNGKAYYNDYVGNTGFDSGGFYTVQAQGFIDTSRLDTASLRALREAYPEFSTDKMYYMSFASHDKSRYANKHVVNVFASTQEELEAMVGSSLVHVANKTQTGYEAISKNIDHLNYSVFDIATGALKTNKFDNDTDLVNAAIRNSEKKRINEAVNRGVFNHEKAMQRIEGILEFDKAAREAGLGTGLDAIQSNGIAFSDIIKGSTGKIGGRQYFTDEELKQLKDIYRDKLGYIPKGEKNKVIDFRTVTNTSAAYEVVTAKGAYYRKLIEQTKNHFGDKASKEIMNDYFKELDKRATVNILKDKNLPDSSAINEALRMSGVATRDNAYYKNRYEFMVGNKFIRTGDTARQIENIIGVERAPENLVTYNLGSKNANSNFLNQLYALRMGDSGINSIRTDVDVQKRQAAYDFALDLHFNGNTTELYKHKGFAKYMADLIANKDIEGYAKEHFDSNQFLTLMGEAIKGVKSNDVLAGIEHIYGDTKSLTVSPIVANILNDVDADYLENIGSGIKRIKTYSKDNRASVVNRLVNVFGIDDTTFEEMSSVLNDDEKATASLIRDITHGQLRTYLDDMLHTADTFGIDVHVDEMNRHLIVEKDGKQVTINKMPTLIMGEDGKIHLRSGGSDINIDIMLKKTKDGKYTRVSTSLDEDFGKKNYFYNIFSSRFSSNGQVILSDFNKYIGPNLRDSYENSRYTGMKTDMFTVNKRFDLSAAEALFTEIIKKDGSLAHQLSNINLANPDSLGILREHISRLTKNSILDDDTLPPDLFMVLANNYVDFALATLDPNDPYYDRVMELGRILGASNKETAFVRGKMQIGDRVIGNWSNTFDNPQRPPMTGAGNIDYLNIEDIENLRDFNVFVGSVMESEDTLRLIHKETPSLKLVSDFKARQAYMSAPMIQQKTERKKKSILQNKAKINNFTINDMTEAYMEEVLNSLQETLVSGTFEQSRVGDARVFNQIIDKPIDVQYLSVNKDVMGTFTKNMDESKLRRLNQLFGTIELGDDGKYVYSRRAGTMVRKNDIIVETLGFGNINDAFGSKFDRGVLSFSISSNKQELSDAAISKIINDYSEQFDGIDNQYEKISALLGILETKGLKATYKIENANMSSYLKVQDAGVEKGMTHILNVQLGKYNEGVRQYFEELQKLDPSNKMISNFKNGMIPTERAVRALHEDVAANLGISVGELIESVSLGMDDKYEGYFSNMHDVLSMIRDEREMLSELSFGKHGFLPGITSLANDNIPKHANTGLAVTGNVSEAIYKYSVISGKSLEAAAAELANAMNDENNNINFLRHSAGHSTTKSTGHKIRTDANGTLIIDSVSGEESFLDEARLSNFMIYTNDLIVNIAEKNKITLDESMKLVHEDAYVYNDKGELVRYKDKEGNAADLIGNFMFFKDDEGRNIVEGATLLPSHGIIADSETESGVSHEYIQSRKIINMLSSIAPENLTEEERKTLYELRQKVAAQKNHVKFMKADDQMLSLLEQQKFNTALEEDLASSILAKTGKEQYFTKEKMEFLSKKSGGAISYDIKTGKVSISDDIKGQGFYDGIVKQIYDRQYYNDVFADELTEEMLNDSRYSHLKGIYDDVIGQGRAEKLGVHQAQALYDLQGMALAADFNDSRFALTEDRFQEMMDNDFKLMSINDYIPAQRSASNDITGSIADKRILLDLGDDFTGRDRYVAIPAGGQQAGDSEVLTNLQGKVNQLKTLSDKLASFEGSGKEGSKDTIIEQRENVVERMKRTREEIVELSDRFARKDTLYTSQAKVEIMEASDRLKIASITSATLTNEALKEMGLEQYQVREDSIQFMKNAKVLMADGSEQSLYELSEQGINYNFKRVGIDHFRKQGYFDENNEITQEAAEKFGMNTEELIEHLQTYGSMDMSIRYPLIRKDSMYATRAYLDRDFDGKNITSISSVSMLSFNGDSDGDSESSFIARINDTTSALYEHQYRQAVNEVRAQGGTLNDAEFQRAVRKNVLDKGVISAEEYEGFFKLNLGMTVNAALDNAVYVDKAKGILLEDVANNTSVGDVSGLVYQVKHAHSKTFSQYKMQSMHIRPTGEEVTRNMQDVRNAIDLALQTNKGSFSEETLQIAQDISSGVINIGNVKGSSKYSVLDDAMHALESSALLEGTDAFDEAQKAITTRVLMQQYYEEEGSKSAKAAIGSINKTLNSLKIVANKAMGSETIGGQSNNLYDLTAARVMQTGAEKIEQQVISFKKVAAELGDSRLIEMENIMNKAKSGDASQEVKDELAAWLNTYLDKGSTNAIWNDIRPAERVMMEGEGGHIANFILAQRNSGSVLSDADLELQAKNQFIAESIISTTNRLVTNDYWKAAIKDISGSGGKTSSSKALRDNNVAPEAFLATQTNNILRNRSSEDSNNLLSSTNRTPSEETLSDLSNYLVTESELKKIDKRVLEKVPLTSGSGLGMAVLGVAAGMMVMGYAGGGHSRPAPPQDDTQEQEPPVLDNMEGASVGMSQQGYVINVSADTRKGARHLKRTMKDMAKATSNGNISINMNYRTTKGGGYSNKDIENVINNFI